MSTLFIYLRGIRYTNGIGYVKGVLQIMLSLLCKKKFSEAKQ